MTAIDRALFSLSLSLVALRIPARKCSEFVQRLQGYTLNKPRIKPILREEAHADSRLLLLAEEVSDVSLEALPPELRDFVSEQGAEPVEHNVTLGYEWFSAEQVLRKILPDGMEVPSAFEQVGHIAHVNLRDEHLPYKATIGQVLLDKNPRLRTVVNKVETLKATNEYRVFPMEILAGEDQLETQVRENGATFRLDYREVYWNSRLEREHRRIVQMLRPTDVVCDPFAGIGPFAVPAALRGCRAYASDLNPASAKWLAANVEANKVQKRVMVSNADAREYVRALLAAPAADASSGSSGGGGSLTDAPTLCYGPFNHVLMNLPATAIEFLDVFVGAFDRERWGAPLPRVHCYCFSKADDPVADVIARGAAVLGCSLPDADAIIVRDVAPGKLMLCLEFTVPEEVAWAPARDGPQDPKRQKTDDAAPSGEPSAQ